MRVTAVTCLRNEGAFVLEWMAHHRTLGITDFLVFSNDCQDGTDAMLDRLSDMGLLVHVRNDGPHPEGPQWAALKAADRAPLVQGADWLIGLDIDEFLTIRTGDGTLPALIAACPEATGFALTWRMFGNAGVDRLEDTPVTRRFLRAAPEVLHWPWRAQMVKTLFRNDGSFRKLGVHRPRNRNPDVPARWVDGSGRPLPDSFLRGRVFTDPGSAPYALAQINHYALGSFCDYLVKVNRGRANRDAAPFDLGYWADRNFCDVEDHSALPIADRAEPLLRGWLADPVLGPLHKAAQDWRQARFASLMADESWRAFYGRLRMMPPSRPLTRAEAEAIRKYGQPEADKQTVS